MKIAKVCLGDPFLSGKGDSKLIIERLRVLREKRQDVELIIFSVGLRSSSTTIENRVIDGISLKVIRVHFSVRRILGNIAKAGIKRLWTLPLQTWLGFAFADCYRMSRLGLFNVYQVVHIYHIRCLGLCDLVDKEDQGLLLDCIDSYTLNMSTRKSLSTNRIKSWCLEWELARISRLERSLSHHLAEWKSARLITVSNIDLEFFEGIGRRGAVVPVGIQIADKELCNVSPIGDVLRCVFFGNLDYDPNISAAIQIMNVARLVQRESGSLSHHVRFTVAGRRISHRLRARLGRAGVNVVSPVVDMKDLVSRHDIAILPMVSGSGMQSKVLEAIAWGKLVIATARCADPIGLVHGTNYIRVESPMEIVSALRSLADRKVNTENIRRAAYRHVTTFSWEETVNLLGGIYSSVSTELVN